MSRGLTTAEFISKARAVHGSKYDYSKSLYKNTDTKVLIVCPYHKDFQQAPYQHLNKGRGCPTCGKLASDRSRSLTTAEFVSKAKLIHGDEYDYSEVTYKNNSTKVSILCRTHNKLFWQAPNKHLSGRGCPDCKRRKLSHSKSKPASYYIKSIRTRWPDLLVNLPQLFLGNITSFHTTCAKCGFSTMRQYKSILRTGCTKCTALELVASRRKAFITKGQAKFGKKYSYNNVVYKGGQTGVELLCPVHGSFSQKPETHLAGLGCPKCGRESAHISRRDTTSSFIRKAEAKHNKGLYTYECVDYETSVVPVSIYCKRCKKYFKQTPNVHLDGCGCPNHENTDMEDGVYEFVSSLVGGVTQRNRSTIAPKELDIIISDLKIAIEFNGLYWHSTKFRANQYHKLKTQLCKAVGYRLIHIWEDDWKDRQSVVESFLRSTLTNIPTVYGRKTALKGISKPLAKEFLSKNHIQGRAANTFSTGLFYNNELVSVCSFTKRPGHWELVRHACKKDIRVLGALSKHTKNFTRSHPGTKLVSFCDLSMFTGGSYEKAGFVLDKVMPPDYKYVIGNKRVHKFNFRRKFLPKFLGNKFDPKLSEVQNMEQNGYYRIFDCGKARYIVES